MKIKKPSTWASAATLWLTAAASMASGGIVGRITEVAVDDGKVVIDGVRYRLSPSAPVGATRGGIGTLTLGDLRSGQVVRFEKSGKHVTRIRVLHGRHSVPH